ncbi:MAG TPA: DUF6072 family protein [Pyrinomonadaceae bacterium]|jgi:hypothetical protein|nr:DUF6072 family protein [Pyrinomonadaceae bacterium]
MPNATENLQTVKTGLQFASEAVIPGGSHLINGDMKQAGIHAVAGIVAGALFGPIGLIVVAANSFARATTGNNLYDAMRGPDNTTKK